MIKRVPVESVHEGDLVRAVTHGPEGRVVDPARRGWTIVRYPTTFGSRTGIARTGCIYWRGQTWSGRTEDDYKGWVISEQVVGDGVRVRQRRVLVVMRANGGYADSEGPTLFSLR